MRSCDICPGGEACAGINLAPILVRVYDLYAAGKTDKFEILFALDEDEEELLETYTTNVSHACWSKAALSAIAEVLVRSQEVVAQGGDWTAVVERTLLSATAAYAHFPWHLPDLVEQAPELHATVLERVSCGDFDTAISKRTFAKLCKASVYSYLK
jgi:hypothetical protein